MAVYVHKCRAEGEGTHLRDGGNGAEHRFGKALTFYCTCVLVPRAFGQRRTKRTKTRCA